MTAIYLSERIECEEQSDSTPKQMAAVKAWIHRNWQRYYHGEPDDLVNLAEQAGWEFVVDIETARRLVAEVKEMTGEPNE